MAAMIPTLVRLTPRERAMLEALAEFDGESLSTTMRAAVRAYLAANAHKLPAPPSAAPAANGKSQNGAGQVGLLKGLLG